MDYYRADGSAPAPLDPSTPGGLSPTMKKVYIALAATASVALLIYIISMASGGNSKSSA